MAPLKPSIAMIVVVNVVVWLILLFDPGYPLFVATGALYGIGIGGAAPIQGVAMGRCFGRANFGRASGLGGIVAVPLLAVAAALSQFLLGETGSYDTSFRVQVGLLAFGGILLGLVSIKDILWAMAGPGIDVD